MFLLAQDAGSAVKIIESLGVAVGCLVILSFAVWKSLVWMGKNVLKPMADRHIKFIDEIADTMKKQSDSIVVIAEQSKQSIEKIEAMVLTLSDLTKHILEVKNVVVKTESVAIHPSPAPKSGT